MTPRDGLWSDQYGPQKIRADEAWVIARGGPTIAVIDTGVDYNHPDLFGKVILGPDFANNDLDPMDDVGHGTHVAGIAAAKANNGNIALGIAGIAWDSPILAIKVFNAGSHVGVGEALAAAAGIFFAANKGVRVMNLSLGGYSLAWQLLTCPAVQYARFVREVVVVTSAGNENTSAPHYPASCAGAFAVGATDASDGLQKDSNFGNYVALAAPGDKILSTVPTGTCASCDPTGYKVLSGTSMAAPHVAGAVAVLLSREPTLDATGIENRLKRTAHPLPAALQLGAGRLDLFEAVFNGSFEEGNMALWNEADVGTVWSKTQLGSILPTDGKRMAFLSTGQAGNPVSDTMTQSFQIQPDVTSFVLSFDYAFISEEYPEFVGTRFNDSMTITLVTPGGGTVELARETVNGSAFTPISGINFPGGDNTVGWTNWKHVSTTVPVTSGPGTYRVFITDAGDNIYDSAVLVDNIRFK